MVGDLESRCVGGVCGADGQVLQGPYLLSVLLLRLPILPK